MHPKSSFNSDLKKEKLLQYFLDIQYQKHLKLYTFKRNNSLKDQLLGVDIYLTHKVTNKQYSVDEKAQLDYINEDLPTFAFELSYLKNGTVKPGWFIDSKKTTDFYGLVTSIYCDEPNKFTSCKYYFVNRVKLIDYLSSRINLKSIERPQKHGISLVPNLFAKKEGYLYLSSKNKIEQPLNLILKLDFLIKNNVAKQLF